MTTFEEYFEDSGLPFVYDDGYIEHKSGYTVGRAYYDDFDDYRPILDVLSSVHKQHPELFDTINELSEHEFETSYGAQDLAISLWDGELSASQKHDYPTSIVVYKDGGVFSHSDHIRFVEGFDGDVNQLSIWLDESKEDGQEISELLKNHHDELHQKLIDEGVNYANDVVKSDEYKYRRVGNTGDLVGRVENANLGKIVKRPGYDGVIIRTNNDWLIDCLDYTKDGKTFIRTEIFWDMSNESPESHTRREDAVSYNSSAYQMIPSEQFTNLAPKLLSNFEKFEQLCREESEKLDNQFQNMDGADVDLHLTNEDLAWENALYM